MGALRDLKNSLLHNPSFTVKEQLGYSAGIFGNAMAQDSSETYSDQFNRDFMGISNEKMTLKGNVATVLSFIVPPIAGTIMDRPTIEGHKSNTKKILGIVPLPFAVMSMLMFIVPSANPNFNFVWAFLSSLLFNVLDSFYDISLSTISLRMTSNPDDRKNFYTISSLASTLGSMLPGWLIPIFIGRTDDPTKQQWMYFIIALIFCIIGVSSMCAPYFTLNEKVGVNYREKENEEKISWNKDMVLAILHNRPFMILEASVFFDAIRQVTYDMLPFLYRNVFDNYGMKAIIDVISGTLSYAGLFAVPLVGSKVSAKNMLSFGYGYTGFFYALMSIFAIFKRDKSLPVNTALAPWVDRIRKFRWVIGVMVGLAGMPNTAQGAARKIIVADSTDYMEWYGEKRFGVPVRSDGMLCAAKNVIDKVIKLFRVNLKYFLFGLTKYQESTKDAKTGKAVEIVQTNSTLRGIYLIFALCGLAGNLLSCVTFFFDNYTGKRKEEIFSELCEMRKIREAKQAELSCT